uniref:Protein kinase domain-containing protein n=1 Tax=Nothobranchius furzeri TaxID=105023 RepID=A0A8C6P5D1_NOTFU
GPTQQDTRPVLRVHQPAHYNTVTPRICAGTTPAFNRQYVDPGEPTVEVNPWTLYSGVTVDQRDSVDLQPLLTDVKHVLGRGGFGVVVTIPNSTVVAKISLFPEMVDWSVPFIEDRFYRYAHVAAQVEEIMLGVSMKHPNVLRTLGGYWCEAPQYALGGRTVILMERAMFSLYEFMARLNATKPPNVNRYTAVCPIIEYDTLKGLEYLQRLNVQHRDMTHRNILVCHQPGRRPIEVVFKISDLGTAANYSTPDQHRGNRVHMPPECLWCLNSTTASDVFSWYCIMWELYTGTPLIKYRASPSTEFCKKTYATSLAQLLGVYPTVEPDVDCKKYYGLDVLRIAPELQPIEWYKQKEKALDHLHRTFYLKRKLSYDPERASLDVTGLQSVD